MQSITFSFALCTLVCLTLAYPAPVDKTAALPKDLDTAAQHWYGGYGHHGYYPSYGGYGHHGYGGYGGFGHSGYGSYGGYGHNSYYGRRGYGHGYGFHHFY